MNGNRSRRSRITAPGLVLALLLMLAPVATAQEATFDGQSVEEWADRIRADDLRVALTLVMAGAEAHPVLRGLLRHPDPDVVRAALRLFRRASGTLMPLVPDVVAVLRHANPEIRIAATAALGRFGNHERTRPALLGALEDENLRVRLVAVATLEELGVPAPRAATIVDAGLRSSDVADHVIAARLCGLLGERARFAIPLLVEILDDNDIRASLYAAGALLALGEAIEPALEKLSRGLEDPVGYHGVVTAHLLQAGGSNARPATDRLLEALESEDARSRATTLEILLYTGLEPERTVDALLAALSGPPGVARDRAEAILEARSPFETRIRAFADGVVSELGRRLLRDEAPARRLAARVLTAHGSPEAAAESLARAGLSSDPSVQCAATRLLGRLKPDLRSTAIRALHSDLTAALTDPVRRAGARGLLNGLDPAEAHPILTRLLASADAEVRAHAVYALCLLCPDGEGTEGAIRARLADPAPAVRREALLALQAIHPRDDTLVVDLADLLLDPDPGVRLFAGAALVSLGTPVAPSLDGRSFEEWVGLLGDESFETWYTASRQLVRHGMDALPLLRALRTHPDATVRKRAIGLYEDLTPSPGFMALRAAPSARVKDVLTEKFGDFRRLAEQVIPELAVALRDPDRRVRAEATSGFRDLIGHSQSLPLLVRTLDDPAEAPRVRAAIHLARTDLETDRVLALLSPSLMTRYSLERLDSIEALGHLGPRAASTAPVLVRLLEHGEEYEKDVCAIALARIGAHVDRVLALGAEAVDDDSKQHRAKGRSILAALGKSGRDAAGPFVARLGDPDELERLRAVQVLLGVDRDSARAVGVLDGARRSPDEEIRQRAAEILEDWRHEPPAGLVNGLRARLRSDDVAVRRVAIELIDGLFGVREIAADVVAALDDPDFRVRLHAESALSGIPDDALRPHLEALAWSGNGPGAEIAQRRLAWMTPRSERPASRPLLERIAKGDRPSRIQAIETLRRSGVATPGAIAVLERCLEDPSVSIRYYAKKALKALRPGPPPQKK